MSSRPTLPSRPTFSTSVALQRLIRPSRWSTWSGPAVLVLLLALLTLFRSSDPSGQFQMSVRWLSIGVLVLAAWVCPSRVAIAVSLIVIIAWSWIEIATPDWTQWLPGHLVRFAVAMGLVGWVIRLRAKLASAQQLARVDNLTGLPNRQALIEAIEAELSRAKRFARSFSIALLDCDGFKQINDLRGHLTGDEVLRRFGQVLQRQTRRFDCAGRWGGDEFLIVLPEIDQDDAKLFAERLRAALRHEIERDYPTLTCSLGIVTFPGAAVDWEDCVRQADEAMYTAKRLGRDQTRFELAEATS
ncbi:MAG: diguanylate cyclase [Schlesneria sp.]|nr:diguanylate cyclase [Schlesneria sp.]